MKDDGKLDHEKIENMLLLTTRKSRDDRKHLQNLCAVIVRPQAHRFNNCWFLPVQRRQTEPLF